MRIVIHFGFPKAMSSTLQYGLFKPLHDAGKLVLRTWRLSDPAEPLELRPSSRLFNDQEILAPYNSFEKGKLNILSDESLTAPVKLRRNNFGDQILNPDKFPAMLKKQIEVLYGSEVEFIPLIIIRNQADLIFSQYVEEYNLKRYKNIDLLFDSSGNVDPTGFDIYKFDAYIANLESVFGEKSVHVHAFEAWRSDLDKAALALGDILNVESLLVRTLLVGSHFNQKTKTGGGYYTKDGKIFIPNLSEDQRRDILAYFEADNRALQQRLGKKFDLDAMGYLLTT